MGRLTGATLSPALLGAGQGHNWLSLFFTTERGSPGTGPKLELHIPDGFGFNPRCRVEPLPAYHYGTMSSRRTGATEPTLALDVVSCRASRRAGTDPALHNVATVSLSQYAKLKAATTYGLRIMAFNAQAFHPSQRDGFRLLTRSAAGDPLDGTAETLRYLASAGEGPGTSFGIYRLPMSVGSFMVSPGNMLPYSETGIPSTIVVFPLRVPFDASSAVDWRLVAPQGYEWDFTPERFRYRAPDVAGADADLPIDAPPAAPSLPPKNVLAFDGNFRGVWRRLRVYGLSAGARVPDATPRSSVNAFYVEFGYSSGDASQRLAGASCEAPPVRALVNALVDYQMTNLAGQQNRILFQLEMVTNLQVGGGLTIEAPAGFVFEESCVLLSNPMRQAPLFDLAPVATMVCTSEVPFTTGRPLVTVAIVRGEVRAAHYEFMIDAENPRWTYSSHSMVWSIHAYANIELADISDVPAVVDGFSAGLRRGLRADGPRRPPRPTELRRLGFHVGPGPFAGPGHRHHGKGPARLQVRILVPSGGGARRLRRGAAVPRQL